MDTDRYAWLMACKFSGNIQPHEEIELDNIINGNPDFKNEYQILKSYWNSPNRSYVGVDTDAAYDRIKERLTHNNKFQNTSFDKPGKVLQFRKWFRAVAAALIFLALGTTVYWLAFHSKNDAVRVSWRTLATQNGKQETITLNDGTLIRLNVGSTLRYPDKFTGNERHVYLSGEAYFEVKKDKRKPFKVFTNKMIVKVLGTAFDIKAYDDDQADEATLVRGSIQVTLKNNPSKNIILKPNEKLVVNNETSGIVVKTNKSEKTQQPNKLEKAVPFITISTVTKMAGLDSTLPENAWIEKKLAFRDEDFESLARQMERWYNVEIEIKSERVKIYRFSGIFTNETIEQALKALQLTEQFKWESIGNKIIINQ